MRFGNSKYDSDSCSSDDFDSIPEVPMKFARFRSRSHIDNKSQRLFQNFSSFEPVKELAEEHTEDKRKLFSPITVVADKDEDFLLKPRSWIRLRSEQGVRSQSSDILLPKVLESNDEEVPAERKRNLKQYFALIDKTEEPHFTTNTSTVTRNTLIYSQDAIEENEEDDQKERSICLSISCKSGSNWKLKVDEIEDDFQLRNSEIKEVVEEAEESDSENDKSSQKARLSRNRRKTQDSLRKITKGDLVCSNIVPFAYTDRPSVVGIDVELIEEDPSA